MLRVWSVLDTFWHSLGLPGGWICDRYDLALGLTRDELRRR
jgi:hypothetical protein